jgi:hypothetical protein
MHIEKMGGVDLNFLFIFWGWGVWFFSSSSAPNLLFSRPPLVNQDDRHLLARSHLRQETASVSASASTSLLLRSEHSSAFLLSEPGVKDTHRRVAENEN